MSDFERELREAREAQRRAEKEKQRVDREELRQLDLSIEERERNIRETARQDYARLVAPVKSTVDRLLQDVARQTWINGYGKGFRDANSEHMEGDGKHIYTQGSNIVAVWKVGITETIGKWGRKGNAYKWHASLKHDEHWNRTEYFGVSLEKVGDGSGRFNVYGVGQTSGTSEEELREFLKQSFLKGPQIESRPEPHFKEGG